MSAAPRAILVGYGRMGRVLAECAIGALEIVGVVDPRPDGAELVASDLGPGIGVYPSLAHVPPADACIIASPTAQHPADVRTALAAGLAVFCEKPLALDGDIAIELGDIAASARLPLQVGFYRRYSPPWRAVHTLLASDSIGEVTFARATFYDGSRPPLAFADPAVSGGLALDNGIHEFDSLAWLLGAPVRRVFAARGPDREGSLSTVGDEAMVSVLLEFEGGVLGAVDLARGVGGVNDTRLELIGSRGRVRLEAGMSGRVVLESGGESHVVSLTEEYWRAGIRTELEAFARIVGGARERVPGAADSARATDVAAASRRAIASGAWEATPRRATLS